MKDFYVRDLVSPFTFAYWGGAKEMVAMLTEDELEQVWDVFFADDMVEIPPTRTDINDFFWFETDTIAEMFGYNNFEEMLEDRKDNIDG